MPRATIASRQLKNKETGMDIFVPAFKESKGLLTSTVNYQVVLVSNLVCFKTPSHKESDVVQYSLEKQWHEFEELRAKVAELFHGTSLPVLNKIAIIVNDHVLRERRNNLDHLLKFVASVPKLATCAPVLEFLGVDSGRARRFGQGEPLENIPRTSEGNQEEEITAANEAEVYDFKDGIDEENNDKLFDEIDDTADDDSLFGTDNERGQVSIFEKQDLKRELTEEDERDFGFIPDAIITKRETIRLSLDEPEDNSDLLSIDDDLDKLLTIDVVKKEKEKDLFLPASSSSQDKPKLATKPKPAVKPASASKPDSYKGPHISPEAITKPAPAVKPKLAPKPQSNQQTNNTNTRSFSSEISQPENTEKFGSVNTFDQDDILKYLRENSETATDNVDLFS